MDLPRTRRSRRWLARLAALSLALVVVPVVTRALARGNDGLPTVARAELLTGRVRRGALVREAQGSGTFVPEREHWLSATVAARVAQVLVRPGGVVAADTVVVVLDNPELELAALESERQAASAAADLARLELDLGNQSLGQRSLVADLRAQLGPSAQHAAAADALAERALISELDRADARGRAAGLTTRLAVETTRLTALERGVRTTRTASRTQLERLREIARFRRQRLAALDVRAGVAGVLTELPVEVGQWVALGAPLGRVAQPDRLKAEVRVAESLAEGLRRGQRVTLESAAGPCAGRIARIDPTVHAGTVRVEVALLGTAPAGARPDLTVTARVELESLVDVLFIPRPAGARDGATMALFRLEPDGAHAARVTVRLGRSSLQQVEVAAGLAEGDQVVLSDAAAWDSHARVRIQ